VHRVHRLLAVCLLIPLGASLGAAQSSQSIARAVQSITAADVARRIGIIADDSMRGRDTPSPELEEVAAYIAGEFRRFGLKPGGDSGTFIQRYGVVRRQLDTAVTTLVIAGRGTQSLKPGTGLMVVPAFPLPERELSGPAVLLAGPADSAAPLGGLDVKGAWVVMPATSARQGFFGLQFDVRAAQTAVVEHGAIGVLLVSNRSDSGWQALQPRLVRPSIGLEGAAAAPFEAALLEIRDSTGARALGIDPAALRSSVTRLARQLEGTTVTFRPAQHVLQRIAAPNVVGLLEGSDPQLKREYVVYSAHMDHVGVAGTGPGCQAKGADSICNGADDDASGTIAVVEAAEAFASLSPRPKRSLVFVTVSGEEKGLWGSQYFADHPPLPIADAIANLNLDMVGRNWTDTISAIGREHSDLGTTLARVAAAHPELKMQPVDDLWPQENFYFRSDHYNFARKGVPILFFFNGTHPDYHQVSDHADRIDAEKESRIVKLVFFLGLELANGVERPKWNPDSYRRIVQAGN
jgi:hypothetical protein